MFDLLIVIAVIAMFIVSAVYCQALAKKWQMNTSAWFAMGITLGPIGVLLALLVVALKKKGKS